MALQRIQELVSSEFPLKKIFQHIGNRESVRLDHFVGSTSAFMLRRIADQHPNLLIVYPEAESAQFAKSDLDTLDLDKTLLFPPTQHKPYDPNQVIDTSVMVQRSEVLEAILRQDSSIVVTSAPALAEKIASSDTFNQASIRIERNEEVGLENLTERLVDQGYIEERFVDQPGEFARRGGILDVFPFSGEYPIRLEFFGDEVDSIREFDPDSQRSIAYLDDVRFVPDASGLADAGTDSLLEYLPDDTVMVLFNEALVRSELNNFFEKAEEAYNELKEEQRKKQVEPENRYLTEESWVEQLDGHPRLYFGGFSEDRTAEATYSLDCRPQPEFNGSFKLLRQNIAELSEQSYDVYILCDSEGQRDRYEELLGDPSEDMRYHLVVETLHEGFILPNKGIALYTDHQIFNRYHRPKLKRRRFHGGISFKELRDLNIGDYVVHVDYGIGKFAGFKKIEVRGVEQESVMLRYQENSILYVNVSSLHKLQKYSGKEGTAPRVTKLGSGEWARKKAKTKKKVKDIARDLIELYAKRKSQRAYAFSPDDQWQTELEAGFEFEETPDQNQAIQKVKQDMQDEIPMDRLVCGDVGFGKTEVAVRAAFKAVMNHKQVGVLVPTTILADQHYKTFTKRMENFPIEIEVLSRFRSKAEQKDIIKRAKAGKVDILIGTHRITSKDVKFDDLGLLIVDEEQRFGVSTKEKLKEFRATVDVLTLTATPIPRTLQFSLMGARDLSVINTPPPNRQPVYTEIHSFDESLIRDAILHEISRGGQVFFIHNRVKNIQEVSDMIRSLVPNVRVRHAHGQMSGRQLEKIIHDFYNHKFDVLVSTNIVENGIDISNANTMIINRADRFGLAELHQLRGRVGRSQRKAYCYLITRPIETLTPESRKRLLALEEFSDLGSGFNIAMRDLDIRGAGDILGAEQSGFINDIGFELYTKILNDAVKELKETEFKDVFGDVKVETELPETQVEFDRPALLNSDYVSDNVERLNLYRKLAGAEKMEQIDDWVEEMRDRFGPLPKAAKNLVTAARIKLLGSFNFFVRVRIRSNRMWLFLPKTDSDLGKDFYQSEQFQQLLKKTQDQAGEQFKLIQKDNQVRFVIHNIDDIHDAQTFLEAIAQDVKIATLV